LTDTSQSTLALTGIYCGLRVNVSAVSGLVPKAASAVGQTGYTITRDQTQGVIFDIVSIAGAENVPDPANVAVSVEYSQDDIAGEIDLDVHYVDIPQDSQLQVESSERQFLIERQAIRGSSLIGKRGIALGALTASLDLKLWVPDPAELKATSRLAMSFSKIEGSNGSVKKVLLQKIQVDLAR
jgi:hypothetical protein